MSALALLPLAIAPVEHWLGTNDATYSAYTVIDIAAPREAIWRNVTRVRAIDSADDRAGITRTLGFPGPSAPSLTTTAWGPTARPSSRRASFSTRR